MKKEEYLKKFKEYNERGVARKDYKKKLDTEYKALSIKIHKNYKVYKDKLNIEYLELINKMEETNQQLENIENDFIKDSEEVLSLLKKVFKDPDLYIRTGRSSFVPKEIRAISSNLTCYYSKNHYSWYDETVKTYHGYLPVTNSVDDLFDICKYLEKRAVNCENKENKELLKSINGEANQKEKYCLIAAQIAESITQIGGKIIYLFYGKVPRFEMAINSLVKRESPYYIDGRRYYWCKSFDNYIKYFNSRQDLNKFLSENIIETNIFGGAFRENSNTLLNTRSYKFEFCTSEYDCEYKQLISKMEELK